mgnify:FL=1
MKKLIINYTFTPADGTVRFNELASINHSGLLLITNVATGEIIYNFADPASGGTVAGNVVTLEKDTTAMSDTDALQIFYDDGSAVQDTDMLVALRLILHAIQRPVNIDTTQNRTRQTTTIESGTVSTVTNLTNLTNIGTIQADAYYRNMSQNTWANITRRTIS